MANNHEISGYVYQSAEFSHAHGFLIPPLVQILESLNLLTEKTLSL